MLKSIIRSIVPYKTGIWLREQKQKAQAIMHKGNEYHCPFCNHSFKSLLPAGSDIPVLKEKDVIGAGYRENALCPRCYSTDRDRLLYMVLKAKPELLAKGTTILHIAPEKSLKKYLQSVPDINYKAGDKFEEEYSAFYYDQDVMQIDITDLSLEDNSVDAIVCNHVLEHIPDERKAMKELYRVMKPKAWAILQVPYATLLKNTFEKEVSTPEERERLFGQFDHVRLYGLDYPDRLKKIGFEVELVNINQLYNSGEIHKYAINDREKVFLVKKI